MTGSLLNVIAALLNALIGAAHAAEPSDPTRPATWKPATHVAEQPAPPVEWKLSLVKIGTGHRSAVLNDTTVGEGDSIGFATVVSIHPSSVVLRADGEEIRIHLAQPLARTVTERADAGTTWKEARLIK